MGGTSVLIAAANARPAVDGVVAVSAPSVYGDMNGVAAVRKLGVPVLYLAGDKDDGFADDSRTLYVRARPAVAHRSVHRLTLTQGVR
jgi:dienelactone hydrolase